MRWNGSFRYRNQVGYSRDQQTGFIVSGGSGDWVDGCLCQIDKHMPAEQYQGQDGQMHSYNYTLFLPKPYNCDSLTIGTEVEITMEDGITDMITIQGIDNQRRYIEIWG